MAADPLDRIAEICHEQPHDALTQIAEALGYTEQSEQERAQREQTLAGLVKRLARRLHPEDPLRVTATGYLQEQGFFNPLRTRGVAACRKCGQTDKGQTGEYACSECGLPTVWDAPAPGVKAEPDMRAICEALGFDPTNHHNAAKCPYCRPAGVPAFDATKPCLLTTADPTRTHCERCKNPHHACDTPPYGVTGAERRECSYCAHRDTCATARAGADCGPGRPSWEPLPDGVEGREP